MVEPGCYTVKEAMEWMNHVAGKINADLFAGMEPMKLAPEKVMWPTLFQSKKACNPNVHKCSFRVLTTLQHYIAGYWETSHEKPDKLYSRGIEIVRRDACELMSECLQQCADLIFLERDVEAAVKVAKRTVEDLYLNKVTMDKLLMTKSLSQKPKDYTTPQAHSLLAQKMAKRDASSAPAVGDRVQFVMTGGGTKRVSEMAEDPLYALEHEIAPNVDYYINNQLKEPLMRLFQPIIGEKRTLDIFSGDHTLKRVRPISSKSPAAGSIMAFAIVKRGCENCGSPYDPKKEPHPTLCPKCIREHGGNVLITKKRRLEEATVAYEAEMATCRTCQGSDRDPVLCMARDCPQVSARATLGRVLTWRSVVSAQGG